MKPVGTSITGEWMLVVGLILGDWLAARLTRSRQRVAILAMWSERWLGQAPALWHCGVVLQRVGASRYELMLGPCYRGEGPSDSRIDREGKNDHLTG